MCPLPMSSFEPESLGAAFPDQPAPKDTLEEPIGDGLPPELVLDLALQELVMRAVAATGASSAILALAHGGEMVCRAATGLHAPALGVSLDTRNGLSGACLRTRQTQCCEDTESDSRVDPNIARRLGIRSILVVPILDRDNLIGALEVFSAHPSAFSDHERTLLEALARECVRVLLAAVEMGQQPPDTFTPVPYDLQPLHQQTSPLPLPAFPESSASQSETEPRYRQWSLILATLAILVAIACTFLVGARLGWLVSSSPPAKAPVPQTLKSDAVAAQPKLVAPTTESTSPPPSVPHIRTAQPVPAHSPSDLVVFDHGKVIFHTEPSKQSGAGPVMDASTNTRIAPLPSVWLAPARAERRLRRRVEPQYPADAKAAHRSGDVLLEVLVAEDGSVISARPLSGDPLLATAAAAAVRQWHYDPYRQHDRPAQFQTDVTLKFPLPN